MKKIFLMFALVATIFVTQACKENEGLSLVYDLTVVGDADGNVNVTFPNGNLNVNGVANLDFQYSNDTTPVNTVFGTVGGNAEPTYDCTLAEGLASDDEEVRTAAELAQTSLLSVTAASGTYYLHALGYVKEKVTGIVFAIDKEFTNRTNAPEAEVVEE